MSHFTPIVASARVAPYAELAELTGPGDVLVLAPHPDDESLGMGGAIAAAVEAGHAVHVAVVTDGSRSHPGSHSHPPKVLSALRKAEVTAAVTILTGGRTTPIWLGYPDLWAPETNEAFAEVAERLAPVLPGVTAIWTTWPGDPHPDHQRVWRLALWCAAGAARPRVFGCPVWGRVQNPVIGAGCEGMLQFRTGPYRALKARAIAAHASQMTGLISDTPDAFRMPRELAEHFVSTDEIFIPA
ncbi:MAG: PIG-L deacetylase family protein [Roseovarius sp.]|uniref:PIG-L deacetylase family protein n=1 Tax=Roseovarius sp. TaxID=1486281 RepID=UPI0032EE9ADD